jgi:chromate transporter
VVPAFCLILAIGFIYRELIGFTATHMVLVGLAAAGVAATLATGIKMTVRMDRNVLTAVVLLAVFIMVGVLHWPMLPVVLACIPVSFALAWFTDKGGKAGE